MNINWKLRFQNKTTLVAIVLQIIALVYIGLGMAGFVPAISENEIVEVAMMIIDLLCLLGIVTDPTTEGIGDSAQAMGYSKPKKYYSE